MLHFKSWSPNEKIDWKFFENDTHVYISVCFFGSFEMLAFPQRFLKLFTLSPLKISFFPSDWFHFMKILGDSFMYILMKVDVNLEIEDCFGFVAVKVESILRKHWEMFPRGESYEKFLSEIIFYLYFYNISVSQLISATQNGPDGWSHFYPKVTQSAEWQVMLSPSHCWHLVLKCWKLHEWWLLIHSSLCLLCLVFCLHMVGG